MNHSALAQGRRLVTSPIFLLSLLGFMLLYLTLQAYILNHTLLNQTLTGAYPLSYKFTLTFAVLTGYLNTLPPLYFWITLLTTLLIGANFAFALASFRRARSFGEMKFTVGGSSLLAVVSSGCPSCGLTALSLLGPSTGAFSFLLQDERLQVGVLGILALSLFYNAYQAIKNPVCTIKA